MGLSGGFALEQLAKGASYILTQPLLERQTSLNWNFASVSNTGSESHFQGLVVTWKGGRKFSPLCASSVPFSKKTYLFFTGK